MVGEIIVKLNANEWVALKTSIKISFIIVILLANVYAQAQEYSSFEDKLIFKAKILTLSSYGVGDSANIIQALCNQKAIIKEIDSDFSIYLIKVNHNQPWYVTDITSGKSYERLYENGDCSYVLIYYDATKRFYRLNGFPQNDFVTLYNDLDDRSLSLYLVFNEEPYKENYFFDLDCYMEKYINHDTILDINCNQDCEQQYEIIKIY
jgi:hypothetical protein